MYIIQLQRSIQHMNLSQFFSFYDCSAAFNIFTSEIILKVQLSLTGFKINFDYYLIKSAKRSLLILKSCIDNLTQINCLPIRSYCAFLKNWKQDAMRFLLLNAFTNIYLAVLLVYLYQISHILFFQALILIYEFFFGF